MAIRMDVTDRDLWNYDIPTSVQEQKLIRDQQDRERAEEARLRQEMQQRLELQRQADLRKQAEELKVREAELARLDQIKQAELIQKQQAEMLLEAETKRQAQAKLQEELAKVVTLPTANPTVLTGSTTTSPVDVASGAIAQRVGVDYSALLYLILGAIALFLLYLFVKK